MPVPLRGLVAPALRLDGHNFVDPRVHDGHVFQRALTEITCVIFQEPGAGQGATHQLPFQNLGLPGAEHFKLDFERAIVGVARQIAARRRFGDDPPGNGLAQRQAGSHRHFLFQADQRLPALDLEGIFAKSLAVIDDGVFDALLDFVNVSSDAQGERIAEAERERLVDVNQRIARRFQFQLRLPAQRVGFRVFTVQLKGARVVANGIVIAAVLGEQSTTLHIGVDRIGI